MPLLPAHPARRTRGTQDALGTAISSDGCGQVSYALHGLARGRSPDDPYRGEVWPAATLALDVQGHRNEASEVVAVVARRARDAADWLPAESRPSFFERNPVNRELLAFANRFAG